MNPQEVNEFQREESSGTSRDDVVNGEYHFRPVQRAENYTDAHYESADETTAPPRYYTPPEKPQRETRSREKGSGGRAAVLICSVLAAALLGGLCGAAFTGSRLNARVEALEAAYQGQQTAAQDAAEGESASEARTVDQAPAVLLSEELSPADIYDQAIRQVVGIRTEITVTNFFGMTSSGAVSGSGFIVSEDGYILTNYHVVEDAYQRKLDIQVMTYDGTAYNATIVGVEPSNDVAVLKIEAHGLNAAVLGSSDSIRVGDSIYAVGNPLGELEFSMSTGHVSALGRVIQTQESESINMFQIDAAVNEGNSGGPVYNAEGDVIGIVTAKYSSSGVEGLGFAIPINDVKSIMDDLIANGYVTGKAYMGIQIQHEYDARYSQYFGLPLGAMVWGVTPGSAAEKTGLQKGDVITAIGEYAIEDYNGLKAALRHFAAFETTELTVYRAGEELRLPITFDEEIPY